MLGLDNPIHILFLLMLLLLVFGAKRLPEIGRSLGSGMRGFKDALTGDGGAAGTGAAQPEPARLGVADPLGARAGDLAADGTAVRERGR